MNDIININKIMRAFDTREELKTFGKENPEANCSEIPTDEVVRFIKENQDKFLFLRWAKLRGANLRGADLEGADLLCADLWRANLEGAKIDKQWHFKLSKEQLEQINQ